jgi:hypothetical protein
MMLEKLHFSVNCGSEKIGTSKHISVRSKIEKEIQNELKIVVVNWDVTLDYTKSENEINVKLCKCGIGTSCEFTMSVHLSNAIAIVIKCKFTCTLVTRRPHK